MRAIPLSAWAVLCTSLGLVTTEARSQQPYAPIDSSPTVTISEASYREILSRLDALETSVGEGCTDDRWEDTSQEKWAVEWGGRVMLDYVTWADQDAGYAGTRTGQDSLEFRRARFRADGHGYGVYFWQIELDFAADDDSSARYNAGGGAGLINVGPVVEMKDVYIGMSDVPLLGDVLIGHFKGPFSMEELTSSRHITFLERALPNAFAPSRDVGIAAFNRTAGDELLWGVGVFADGVPESTKQLVGSTGTQVIGRVVWSPIYDQPSGGRYVLHLGSAIRHVWNRDSLYRLRVRPETHESVRVIDFDGDNDLADQRTVYGAELAWVFGRFSLQGEAMVDVVDVNAAGTANAYAAYVQGSYFLTGEHRVYKRSRGTFDRVKPYTNFWIVPGCIGWGAWELKARWSYIDVGELYAAGFTGDTNENAEQVNNMAIGFNWYWTPYARMMFDYWHSWSKRPGLAADNADLIGMRIQYDF